MYNLYNFEAQFKDFLISENISRVSVRNYLSDLRFLFGWLIQNCKAESLEGYLDIGVLNEYKKFLIQSELPIKTINRRLSTLRKFCTFCVERSLLKANPQKSITNISLVQEELKKAKLNTIKKFEGDVLLTLDHNRAKDLLQDVSEFMEMI
jgi:site-specific recombinase XerC